jgi:hypothetical protein
MKIGEDNDRISVEGVTQIRDDALIFADPSERSRR